MKEAVILAGGFGTRLRSVVSDVPKPMAPVAGRPFLEILIDYLMLYGFDHIVLSTGYMHEVIEHHFGNSYRGIIISYAIESTPLGTGGGIRNAIEHCESDDIVVINGDTLFKVDYDDLQRFYHSHPTRLAVVLRQVADASRYGSVETDCCDRIIRYAEKKQDANDGGTCKTVQTINGGIYMMHRSLLEDHRLGEPFAFEKDILQGLFVKEPFYAFTSSAYFLDIGIPDDYFRLIEEYDRLK